MAFQEIERLLDSWPQPSTVLLMAPTPYPNTRPEDRPAMAEAARRALQQDVSMTKEYIDATVETIMGGWVVFVPPNRFSLTEYGAEAAKKLDPAQVIADLKAGMASKG